jgi:glycerophosphoryl diester phosphodiesterase
MPAPAWLTSRPIAHRGLHDVFAGRIENTLAAAGAAIEAGFAIEVDLQVAACGTPVVFHDDTLERLTSAIGPVAERTAAELGRIEIAGSGETVPTFEDLLERVAGQVPLLLELKRGPRARGLGARIAVRLNAYDGPAAIMSFEPGLLLEARRAAPSVVRGLASRVWRQADGLSPAARLARRWLLPAFDVAPQFIAYDVRALPALAPALARRLGLPVLAWTVRSYAERRTAAVAADQIIFEGFNPDAK